MTRHDYREHDYTFGQAMLTQAGLAERLRVSRRAVGEWEGGLNYAKAEHFKHVLGLCVQQHVFAPEREEEEIRALWKTAHQRVLLDESWLAANGSSISRRGTQCTGLGKSIPEGERFSQEILFQFVDTFPNERMHCFRIGSSSLVYRYIQKAHCDM